METWRLGRGLPQMGCATSSWFAPCPQVPAGEDRGNAEAGQGHQGGSGGAEQADDASDSSVQQDDCPGDRLVPALRADAEDLYALKASAGLIIAHGTWLARDDFACFIHHGTGTAAIDWEAAIGALDACGLPSSGERRMLRLAASLADQAPVSLGEAITGIDDRNVGLLVRRPPRLRTTPVPDGHVTLLAGLPLGPRLS